MSKEKASIHFSIEPEVKAKLEQLAKQEERTLGGQTARLFNEYVIPHLDSLLDGPQTTVTQ